MQESVYNRMTKAEKEVAQTLRELNIQWTYEQPVFVWDETKRPRVWTPDFYLKNYGVYIEVCGSEQFNYEYRRKIYEKNGHGVIYIHMYKQKEKWKAHLIRYLRVFTMNRYHELFHTLQKHRS
jgi:predicted nuclease of restriction endonuclease-like RecB superfamily